MSLDKETETSILAKISHSLFVDHKKKISDEQFSIFLLQSICSLFCISHNQDLCLTWRYYSFLKLNIRMLTYFDI